MGLFDGVGKTLQKNLNDIMASRGMVPLHELVRRIHEGDSSKWHEAATKANSVVEAHQDASERSMKMLQVLESSWTGEGADAAAEKIRAGAKATEMAAAVYAANARRYTDSAYTFDNVKQQLPPIPETPPERDFIDVLTPWDTDNEKQVNQYKADVQRARQIYDGYEQAMRSAQQGVVQDFGRFDSFDTGDRELGTIERSESRQAESSGTGVKTFHEPGPSVSAGAPVSGGAPTPSPISGGAVPSGSAPSLQSPTPVASSQPNGSTSLSGYVPPDVNRPTPGYSPPNLNPTTGFGPGSGGGGTSNTPGFGPVGTTGGFGPAGGGSSTVGGLRGRLPGPGLGGVPGGIGPGGAGGAAGGGAGGATGGGAGGAAPGAGMGRGTGAVPFGPSGGGGPVAAGGPAGGASSAAAGRGAMPMGAMGGAGRGGQGGDDQEHQRQYVQATDEAFQLIEDGQVLRDPNTGHVITPPTIGG